MNKVVHLSLARKSTPAIMDVVEQATAPEIDFILDDYTPAAGATAQIYIKKDESEVFNTCTITDNVVHFAPTPGSFDEAGQCVAQVQIIENDAVAVSYRIFVTVEPNYIDGGAIEASNEYGALVDALKTVGDISRIESDVEYLKAQDVVLDDEFAAARQDININKQDIDVLEAQVQALIEGGSVDPDAELVDIRIGYNGKVYSSAGDAVRTQSKVAADGVINRFKGQRVVATAVNYNTIALQSNKIIKNTGEIANGSDATKFFVTEPIPVECGQILRFDISSSRWANRNYVFHNADGETVLIAPKASSGSLIIANGFIIVPPLAKYAYVAFDLGAGQGITHYTDVNASVITEYSVFRDETIEKVFEETELSDSVTEWEAITPTLYDGYTNNYNGHLVTMTDSSYKVIELTVSNGEIYDIANIESYYDNCTWSMHDMSGQLVEFEKDNTLTNKRLLIPYGVTTVRVSGFADYPTVKRLAKININKEWKNKKWICVGDSLTDTNNTRTTKWYHQYIADLTGIETYNMGKSGTGYMKPYSGNAPFYQRILDMPTGYDVITIFGSVNDMSQPLGTPTDTGTDTVCGCINTTLDNLYSIDPTIPVGIITPTPTAQYYPLGSDQRMTNYVEALKTICANRSIPFLDLYHASDLRPWDADYRTLVYSNDGGNGTHPNEIGHKILASKFKAFLNSLIL